MGKKLVNVFWLVLCLFLACVASCSTKRTISGTREDNAIDAKINTKIETYHKQTSQDILYSTMEEHLGKLKTITFRIYDTEKEPDSLGNYPLLADGVINEETQSVKTLTSADSVIVSVEDTASVDINNKIEIKHEKDEINYTKKENPSWYSLVTLLCVIAFVFFVIKIYPK